MGTNFYARVIPSELSIKDTLKSIKKYLKGELPFLNEDNLNIPKRIHLGKRSAGWQFLWQENQEYYQNNLKSIKEFLSKDNVIIYDEYGEVFTVDKLFEEELNGVLYNDALHINGKQYQQKSSNDLFFTSEEFTTEDGLRFKVGEFS